MPQDLTKNDLSRTSLTTEASLAIETLSDGVTHTILTEVFEEEEEDDPEYQPEQEMEWEDETEYGLISDDELLDLKSFKSNQKPQPQPARESLLNKKQLIQLFLVLVVSMIGAALSNYFLSNRQTLNATKTTSDENQNPLLAIRKDILQLKSKANIYEHSTKDIQSQLRQVQQNANNISTEIDTLKSRVNNLELFAKEHGIFNLLNESLPENVPVYFDSKSGNLTSIVELWQVIATELQANQGSKKISETIQNYLENTVRGLVYGKQVPQKQTPVYVSKSVFFKQVLEKELESLKFDLKKEFASMNNAIATELPDLSSNSAETNKTLVLVDALIKNAIQRYVKHTISKPDYADLGSGAKIIPELTSSSYDWKHELPELERKLHQFLGRFGFGRMKVNGPQIAFRGGRGNSVSLGGCWPINGQSGQVGIDLGKTIKPTDIGVLHIKAEESPNPKTAPRHISLHVDIEEEETRNKLRAALQQQEQLSTKAVQPSNLPETFVKISTVEYDLFKDEFQVFKILTPDMEVHTSRVVFTIDDNWGDKDLTCVYRLRLFGERVNEEDN